MERIVRFVIRPGLLGFVLLLSSLSGAQSNDAVEVKSVVGQTAPLANTIIAGQPFEFTVVAEYFLASADNAVLQVGAEEYPKSAGGCKGAVHQTNGGNKFGISRGKGSRRMAVTWRGDHPVYAGGGYITFSAGYVDAATNDVLRQFGPFTQYCYRFVPAGGERID